MAIKTVSIKSEIPQREWVEFTFSENDQGMIDEVTWKSNGCHDLLAAAAAFSNQAKGKTKSQLQWNGNQHWDILIREVVQKLQQNFALPYKDEELCHCRKIPTAKVDQAIVLGAHTPEKVRAWTTASSGCGTCRPDIESMIQFRVK